MSILTLINKYHLYSWNNFNSCNLLGRNLTTFITRKFHLQPGRTLIIIVHLEFRAVCRRQLHGNLSKCIVWIYIRTFFFVCEFIFYVNTVEIRFRRVLLCKFDRFFFLFDFVIIFIYVLHFKGYLDGSIVFFFRDFLFCFVCAYAIFHVRTLFGSF